MRDNFRAVFEDAPIGMGIIGLDGKLINVNKSLCTMLGYQKEELLGTSPKQVTHPDEDLSITDALNMNLAKGIIDNYEIEKRYIHKKGHTIDAILKTSLIRDDNGEPNQFLGQLLDITSQKKAREKIIAHEQLLNNINENIEEAIYRSIPGQGLAYVNKAFVKMFGWNSIEECLKCSDKDVNDLFDEENGRKPYLKKLAQHGYYKNSEILFRRRDGTTFWGLDNCIVTKNEDGSKYIDGVIVDITEKRKADEMLIETNNELKKTNNELDRFVYSASHDLKAPLASLHGLLNIATADAENKEMKYYLGLMEQSVVKLESFIQDIIRYSRNTRTEIFHEEINVPALINGVTSDLQFFKKKKEIDIQLDIVKGVNFYSDAKRITIILNNLISNSISYYDPSKTNPFIKIRFEVNRTHGIFEVIDNGVGIKEQYVGRIFDMFYRASESSNGSGLGLYIVKETIDKLNGSIEIYSEFKTGTKFLIKIPNAVMDKNESVLI